MRPFFALTSIAGLLAASVAFAAAPTTPGNLTADVYSDTAAELFWSRSEDSDGFVRGYEIRKNGELLTTIDALSFFTDDLVPGEINAFTVTAIDFNDERSAAASVAFITGGTAATDDTQVDVSDSADRPTSPANLRVSVYSNTAAEVFWDRVEGQTLSYEVSINGAVVQTTFGTSSFLDNLTPGSSAQVDVVAIDASGQRSSAANVTVTTGGASSVADISTDEDPPTSSPEAPTTTPVSNPAATDDTLPEIRPQDLSIEVYSASTAELFWTPVGNFRPRIFANEIRRDGVLIDTVEGEFLRSYLDATREQGVIYEYQVTAVSSAGRATASITGPGFNASASDDLVTNDPEPLNPAPINAAIPIATEQRLELVLSIVNGEAVEQTVATFFRLADRDYRANAGFELISSILLPNNSVTAFRYSCPDGGDITDFELNTSDANARFGNSFEATNCTVGPITTSGSYQGRIVDFEPGILLDADFINVDDGSIIDERDDTIIEFERMGFFRNRNTLNTLVSEYSLREATVNQSGIAWNFSGSSLRVSGADELNMLPDGSTGTTVNGTSFNNGTLDTDVFDGPSVIETLGPIEFANGRELGQPSAGRLTRAWPTLCRAIVRRNRRR